MDSDRDPYEVLGVPRDATDDEIKEAYREKAKQHHPDASDRDDAAEVFKRVKEAYETIHTEDREKGDSASSSSSPDDSRTEAGTEQTGDRTQDGFWKETQQETGPGAGFGKEGDTVTGTDAGARGKREPGDTKEEEEDGEAYEETDGDPDEFEVHEELGMGWKLGKTETGDWFVFTEGETAPYVDGKQMLYLDSDGRMSTDAIYFGTRDAAEDNYEEHYGEDDGFEHEHKKEESHRGFSMKGESYARRTEEREDGFVDEEEGWDERQEAASFDELWKLYYQERKEEGETLRRWGVTTDVADDDRFVNPDGEYQETEFWFGERHEAVRAYERYVQRTKAAHEGFEGTTVETEGETSVASEENRSEENIVVGTASKGLFLFEALDDTAEALRERKLVTVTVLTAVCAVSAYLFEPFRRLLLTLFLPVYNGFNTILQTSYLMFFVFAYAAIVTSILLIHISTRY